MKKKIIIAGGGIIGLFTAYYLLKSGHQVTIVDKGNMSDGCSYGNAGLIVPSHVIPLASPAMASSALKCVINPKSPVSVKMIPSLDFLSWSLRFFKTANSSFVKEASVVLKELTAFSQSLYTEVTESGELAFQHTKKGLLMICRTAHTLREETEGAHIANDLGVPATILPKEELLSMEPSLTKDVVGGIYYPKDENIYPNLLMSNLISWVEESGATILRRASITAIEKGSSVVIDGEKYEFDELIISAGAWSNDLLRLIGSKVPLQPGRGYSFNLKEELGINYPALVIDNRIAVTPFQNKITRFAGGMELGYFNSKVKNNKLHEIIKSVKEVYPLAAEFDSSQLDVWAGHRPCSFDGLPYIGRIPGKENIYIAAGHAMLGITLAPATGKLISELIDDKETTINLYPLRINR